MSTSLRLAAAVATAAAAGSIVTAGAAAPAASPPMRIPIVIGTAGHDGIATPENFAVRAGGSVVLAVRNDTSLFHTFTIPELGISALIAPHRTTAVRLVAPYGVYRWHCVLCPSGAHPHAHPMHGTMYAIIDA